MTSDDYLSHDALGLAEIIRRGDVQPQEVLEAAIERTEEVNPEINAICIEMYEEARKSAADPALPDGPFRGVPFLLKDLGLYYRGFRTTSGCRFFADNVADHDSELVRRYKAAGLVVFGKSATPEFGLTTTTESILFGQTRNPWSLEHSTGGSSGGAAAAVAAGILPAAHASDGGGSIRVPASCCGLFGLKPTRARNPMGPDVGEGWSGLSTHHVVSWSVRDSAAILDQSAGPDSGDPYWAPPPTRAFLEEVGSNPGRLRIGLSSTTFNGAVTDAECRAAVEDTAKLCEELGHDVGEAELSIDSGALGHATRTIVSANILATLIERSGIVGREFGDQDAEPMTLSMVESARDLNAADYAQAIRTVHSVGRQVGRFFSEWDVLLTPTMATPPKRLGILAQTTPDREAYLENLLETIGFTQLMNVAGNPAASLPLHQSDGGLPIGSQLAAAFGGEDLLFRLSAQIEEARPWAAHRPALGRPR